MKIGVLVFPGSNCDHDGYHAFAHILNCTTSFIWHKDRDLKNSDLILVPGGFSYGDYLRSGAIARFSPVMEEVAQFAQKGGLVLGVCNGFQILLEAGLLPGAMLHNNNLRFVCKSTFITPISHRSPFTEHLEKDSPLEIPVAHGEGNYFISSEGLDKLYEKDQIAFKYCTNEGEFHPSANPNGSIDNIAGITNEAGNVLGMMPHPERAVESLIGSTDGLHILSSAISSLT